VLSGQTSLGGSRCAAGSAGLVQVCCRQYRSFSGVIQAVQVCFRRAAASTGLVQVCAASLGRVNSCLIVSVSFVHCAAAGKSSATHSD